MITRHIENLRKIFLAGVEAVKPKHIFSNQTQVQFNPKSEVLTVQNVEFPTDNKNIHLVGFGKAVFLMAVELEKLLGTKLTSGLVNIPLGTRLKYPDQKLLVTRVIESAENNLPDARSVEAAKEIMSKVSGLTSNDILFVLISGGGSALLPLPKEGVLLEDKLDLIKKLQKKGADIKELNAVRIGLSASKGGKLAKAANKCHQVIGLIISDVVNDPIDLIASGPTTLPTLNGREVLEKYDLWKDLQPRIQNAFVDELRSGLKNVENFVVANNKLAVESCRKACKLEGYQPFVLTTSLEGEVKEILETYKTLLEGVLDYRKGDISGDDLLQRCKGVPFLQLEDFSKFIEDSKNEDVCFIISGETTVNIQGSGKGGRNQELSLRMSRMFYENDIMRNLVFLSAGTDGIDGPTDAAGAIGVCNAVQDLMKCEESLKNNDSYNYFNDLEDGKYLIKTGHTGTNVMDIHLILIPKK